MRVALLLLVLVRGAEHVPVLFIQCGKAHGLHHLDLFAASVPGFAPQCPILDC
jgi:hypothetical protein